MKLKGFTLVELLVVIVIMAACAGILVGVVRGISSGEEVDYSFIDPQVETARSQRRMVDEMSRQNDLMQRRLELLESQKQKAENE